MCAIPFNTCNWICVALLISRNFFHSYEKEKTNSFKEKKWKWSPKKKRTWIILSGINSFCPIWHHTLLEKKNEITNSHKIYLKKILKKPDLYPPRIFSYLTHSFFSIHKSFCVLIQNLFFLTTIHPQFCYYHWPNFFSLSPYYLASIHTTLRKSVLIAKWRWKCWKIDCLKYWW